MSHYPATPPLTRRRFVGGIASAAAVAPWVCTSRATEHARPDNSLGYSLYGMQGLPVNQAIQTCAEIGYTNVEFALISGSPTSFDQFGPSEQARVRQTLTATGLYASSLLMQLHLVGSDASHVQSLESIRAAAAIGAILAPENRPILESAVGGRPRDTERAHATMVERLRDWDRLAGELDVTIAIKAHVSSAITRPDHLLGLLRDAEVKRVAAAFDQSHYDLAGLPMDASFPQLAGRTRFVHVKDVIGTIDDYHFVPPGEGATDYAKLFALFRRYEYRGPVVVEISRHVFSRPDYDAIDTARRCYAKLAPLLAATT